jgi:hypothetical protein
MTSAKIRWRALRFKHAPEGKALPLSHSSASVSDGRTFNSIRISATTGTDLLFRGDDATAEMMMRSGLEYFMAENLRTRAVIYWLLSTISSSRNNYEKYEKAGGLRRTSGLEQITHPTHRPRSTALSVVGSLHPGPGG